MKYNDTIFDQYYYESYWMLRIESLTSCFNLAKYQHKIGYYKCLETLTDSVFFEHEESTPSRAEVIESGSLKKARHHRLVASIVTKLYDDLAQTSVDIGYTWYDETLELPDSFYLFDDQDFNKLIRDIHRLKTDTRFLRGEGIPGPVDSAELLAEFSALVGEYFQEEEDQEMAAILEEGDEELGFEEQEFDEEEDAEGLEGEDDYDGEEEGREEEGLVKQSVSEEDLVKRSVSDLEGDGGREGSILVEGQGVGIGRLEDGPESALL
jgi:hypothetical protein